MYAPLHCAKQQKYKRDLLISNFTSNRTVFSVQSTKGVRIKRIFFYCIYSASFAIIESNRHRSPCWRSLPILIQKRSIFNRFVCDFQEFFGKQLYTTKRNAKKWPDLTDTRLKSSPLDLKSRFSQGLYCDPTYIRTPRVQRLNHVFWIPSKTRRRSFVSGGSELDNFFISITKLRRFLFLAPRIHVSENSFPVTR